MLLNPFACTFSNVDEFANGFPHEVSSGSASREFPKFHPGFKLAKATEAVTGVKVVVHCADTWFPAANRQPSSSRHFILRTEPEY